MKKIKLLAILFLFFTACQKGSSNTSTNTGQNGPSIVGQWEWFRSGGALATQISAQSSGLSWGLKFNSDSTYLQTGTRFTSGIGVYSLGGFPILFPLPPGSGQHAIKLSMPILAPYPYYVYWFKSTDTLYLMDPWVAQGLDGQGHILVRK